MKLYFNIQIFSQVIFYNNYTFVFPGYEDLDRLCAVQGISTAAAAPHIQCRVRRSDSADGEPFESVPSKTVRLHGGVADAVF